MTPDDEVVAALRRAADHYDPVPDHVLAAARAALSTRDVDGELLALLLDSDLADAAQVRSASGDVRVLSFETGPVSVELQVEYSDGLVSVRGLVCGAAGDAVVQAADERRVVPVDAEGWFAASDLPRGPLRVRVRTAAGANATTSWVLL